MLYKRIAWNSSEWHIEIISYDLFSDHSWVLKVFLTFWLSIESVTYRLECRGPGLPTRWLLVPSSQLQGSLPVNRSSNRSSNCQGENSSPIPVGITLLLVWTRITHLWLCDYYLLYLHPTACWVHEHIHFQVLCVVSQIYN